ncbi:hypothetical protein OF385_05145 [Glutamicibacter sp. JL.03c]|uniref:hypothetical protein n=1 Tax=Glutamicibacter sp. JL.03c TaxID=2984842 RepID=UPI0021F7D778|nr:hypothetical protein [Glutamicibacter sp. JL.03c]UYQ78537.1 hypothetical protein OF385_05145 [Glutamicibacter sp. JL.03c]
MTLNSRLGRSAMAGLLACVMGLSAMPAAQANNKTYTQPVASAGTCTTMETATVAAFKSSGYKVRKHACLQSAGGYTLVIGYSK